MLSRRIFVIAFALFTAASLTACPRDIVNTAVEKSDLTKEYNEKIDQANQISLDLTKKNVFIDIGPLTANKALTSAGWSTVSSADRLYIRQKLTAYLTLINRIIELAGHRLLKDEISSSTRSLQKEKQTHAKAYLDDLNRFEGAKP